MNPKSYLFKIFAASILLLPTILNAQIEQKNQKDTLQFKLKQVTVSATRYSEPILEIPYAVSIITKNQLLNSRSYGIEDAVNSVPGVLAQTRSGNHDIRLVIRGFGARGAGDRSNSGTTRGIRIMVDGIPETEPDGRTPFDLIDLSAIDNIEIIRSNASATWGNAAGGVVNFSTVPFSESSYIKLNGNAGSFGFNKISISALSNLSNGKIYGGFTNTNFSGWRNHSSSSRTFFNLGFISQMDSNTKLGVFTLGAFNLFHIPGPLTQKQFDTNPQQANPTYLSRDERRFNRIGRIGVTIDHFLNATNEISAMLFASPKFLQRSERGTFRDFTRYHIGGNFIYKNFSSFSEFIENKLILGFDEAYQDGAILFYSLSPTNGRGDKLNTNKREGANNFGVFLQDEIIFNDRLSVIAGLRYDKITYYSEDFINSSYGVQEKSFDRFTPKAGLTYRITPAFSLYANLGGGVEVPAGNETDPSSTYGQDQIYLLNPLLEPIVSTTLEFGTKQIYYWGETNFIKSLSVDAALYNISTINDIIPYRGGRFYFTAGKTNRLGAEFGIESEFASGLSVKAAFTFSNNRYIDYLIDSVHYGKPGKLADYSENKVAGIPNQFYNISFKYIPAFFKEVYTSVNINSVGSYFADDENKISVSEWLVINLTLGLNKEIELGSFGISGFITINNLFDKKYASSAFINPDFVNGAPVFLEPGLPRNYNLSLSISL